ncbi:MarR family transcriptional regulator [Virgibacillus sp. LDC1]|uniref:MarR family winged helix-turn-helix transcriptional regulator n=1 Tax=Paenibacillus lautus TaxID=1401 RepID=UPI002DB57DC1|nr:MarR family transcriptional regulator [Paenibacillus lautus]MCV4235177.1 MarR family transcriptional regulator [Virgibacillus sp. LDC1]MEC0307774.1 MarR family transcriptional regulator [Paenibacillus lautus]
MDAHRHFFHKYFTLYRPFVNELNRKLEDYNLYYAQWSIMYYLDVYQSMTLVELSKMLYVEKPTVTRTVNALIKLDYVEQIPVRDKREKRIQLSKTGAGVVQQVRKVFDQYEQEIMEGVSTEDQATVIRVMETVRDNIIRKGD